jgi:hypothetical protein
LQGATPYEHPSNAVSVLVKGVGLVEVIDVLLAHEVVDENHPPVDGMVARDFFPATGDLISARLEALGPIGGAGRDGGGGGGAGHNERQYYRFGKNYKRKV